jgi:hypothetical protein
VGGQQPAAVDIIEWQSHYKPVPDVHVPKLEAHGSGHSIFKILLEVILISVGVFFGLAGEQWRENARHRELAEGTLQRFRTEIVANRQAVVDVRDYHVALEDDLKRYLAAAPAQRKDVNVRMTKGFSPANLSHTAWDLALATQSLAYVESDLGFALSDLYRTQERLMAMTMGLTQAMYINPPNDDLTRFIAAVYVYYGDATLIEPQLVKAYDALLPRLDTALGATAK